MSYVLSVWFYEFQPRAGLWAGDEVLTTYVHKAKHYPTWDAVRSELKLLRKKYVHSFWQPLEISQDNDQIVIPFPTPEQEAKEQIDNSQYPGIRRWRHACAKLGLENVVLSCGDTCSCCGKASSK